MTPFDDCGARSPLGGDHRQHPVAGLLINFLRGGSARNDASETRAANLEAVGEVARQLATQSDPRGWAGRSARPRCARPAPAAVLWRPTPAGSELIASSAAGQRGRHSPALPDPRSGAIQAFTSADRRFDTLGKGPRRPGLPRSFGRRRHVGAGAEGPGRRRRGARGLLGRGARGGRARDERAVRCWRSRPRSRSNAASCSAGWSWRAHRRPHGPAQPPRLGHRAGSRAGAGRARARRCASPCSTSTASSSSTTRTATSPATAS